MREKTHTQREREREREKDTGKDNGRVGGLDGVDGTSNGWPSKATQGRGGSHAPNLHTNLHTNLHSLG